MFEMEKEVFHDGIALHNEIPKELRRPSDSRICLKLGEQFYLTDDVLCRPTIFCGEMGSGKSQKIIDICRQIDRQRRPDDALIVFCAKPELLDALYQPGDAVLAFDSEDPSCVHNIFREIGGANVTMQQARTVLKEILQTIAAPFYRHTTESFFIDASMDMLENLVLFMREDAIANGTWNQLSNAYLLECLDNLCQKIDAENGSRKMAWEILVNDSPLLRHCSVYLGNTENPSELCLSVLSQLRTIVHRTFVGAFAGKGTFSTVDAIRKGGRIFLLSDYATSATSTAPLITTILNRFLQLSIAQEREANQLRAYFVFDEMAQLEKLRLLEPFSYGRSAGCRVFMSLQSLKLLEKTYSPSEATQILGLTPNIMCFYTTCPDSRAYLSKRCGVHYVPLYDSDGKMLQVIQEPVISDVDYAKISNTGDAFMLVGHYEPFIYHGFDPNYRRN